MRPLVLVTGSILVGLGLVALVRPASLSRWLASWQQDRALRAALALRFGVGALLVAAAPQCRAPQVVLALGLLVLLSGLVGVLLGAARLRALARWWSKRPAAVVRLWAASVVGLGAFFVYAGT